MEFRLLGRVRVLEAGRQIPISGDRQRALLVALLLRPNDLVSTDRLIDELWGESPPLRPENALQALVSRLRRALGDRRLEYEAGGYRLRVEPGERDLDRFEELRAAGKPHEALALWRGPPLADVEFYDFARIEIARLAELRLATLEERIDADLARGRHRELVPELESLVAEHPSREQLQAQLLLALYRSGRQSDALAAYRRARNALVTELGLEPGEELRRLEQAILRHDPSLGMPSVGGRALTRVAVAAAGLVAFVAAVGGATGTASVPVRAREVAVLDAADGRVVATTNMGFEPTMETIGNGRLWVGGRTGVLAGVDPARLRVVLRTTVGDEPVAGLAAGDGRVWIAEKGGLNRTILYRLDPRGGRLSVGWRLSDRTAMEREGPEPLAVSGMTLWATNALTTLTRIDLRTGRVVTTRPDNGAGSLWASPRAIWILTAQTDTLARVDARTLAPVIVIPLAQDTGSPRAVLFPIKVVVSDGTAWIVEEQTKSLGRVDTQSNEVLAQVPLGHRPNSVAAANGIVWAACSDGTLERIDPLSNRIVQTVHLPGRPNDLALWRGRLYVTLS